MRDGWKETEATVVSSVQYRSTGRILINSIDFTYKVESEYYYGKFTTFGSYENGQIVPLFYDPRKPEHNNYWRRERFLNWFYVVFFALLSILAIYLFAHPSAKQPGR